MIRVLVADAHPVVRYGLVAILTEHSDITVPAEAATGAEVCRLVTHDRWNVIVLDPNLSEVDGPNGLELLKEIKHRRPKLPILVLAGYAEEDFAARALRAGAAGYLQKTAVPEELVGAVRRLAEGRKYMNPAVAEELIEVLSNSSEWIVQHRLSDREYQVMCLMGSGKSVREIAHELRLSVKTIATHRVHILKKMEMQTDAQLVHYVLQRRLAEPR